MRHARGLLASAFFFNAGSFAVLIFLVIYLQNTLHLPPWQTGTVLTIYVLVQRLLPIASGPLGDRYGHRPMIFLGFVLRALGFLGFLLPSHLIVLVIASLFVGIGGALYTPSMSAILWAIGDRELFTYWNQAMDGGFVVGALAGGYLMPLGFDTLFWWAGGCLLMAATSALLSPGTGLAPASRRAVRGSIQTVLSSRPFLVFSVLLLLYRVVWQQLTVSIPLQAAAVGGTVSFVGDLFAEAGLVGIVLMFFMRPLFLRYAPMIFVRYGTLLVGLALAAVPLMHVEFWLGVCIFLFMAGEVMAMPGMQVAIAEFSGDGDAGAYFGVAGFAQGIGSAMGSYLGPFVLAAGDGEAWPWFLYGAIGVLTFLALVLHGRRFGALNKTANLPS